MGHWSFPWRAQNLVLLRQNFSSPDPSWPSSFLSAVVSTSTLCARIQHWNHLTTQHADQSESSPPVSEVMTDPNPPPEFLQASISSDRPNAWVSLITEQFHITVNRYEERSWLEVLQAVWCWQGDVPLTECALTHSSHIRIAPWHASISQKACFHAVYRI